MKRHKDSLPFCLFLICPRFLSRAPLIAPRGCLVGGFIGASVAIANARSLQVRRWRRRRRRGQNQYEGREDSWQLKVLVVNGIAGSRRNRRRGRLRAKSCDGTNAVATTMRVFNTRKPEESSERGRGRVYDWGVPLLRSA